MAHRARRAMSSAKSIAAPGAQGRGEVPAAFLLRGELWRGSGVFKELREVEDRLPVSLGEVVDLAQQAGDRLERRLPLEPCDRAPVQPGELAQLLAGYRLAA